MPWVQKADGWYYEEYTQNAWGNTDTQSQGPYPQPNASGAPPTGGVYAWQGGAAQDPPQQTSAAPAPAPSAYSAPPAAPSPAAPAASNPVGSAPAATGSPSSGLTAEQSSAKAALNGFLSQYGLDGLGDFAWDEYLNGSPIAQIMLDIRSRPEYKARFPAMAALAAKGHAMTEKEYVDYERSAAQIFSYAGLAQFATPSYLQSILENEVSLDELGDRIRNGYEKVIEAPPEVRNQFAEWFGPNGDAALAGWFLDATHTEPFIKDAVATAQAGGYGDFFGFDLSQAGAHLIGQIAPTVQGLVSGFNKALQFKPLIYETISEKSDLTADQTVEAAFGTGGGAQEAFQKRLEERVAAGSGGGHALQTQTGLVGAGTAQQ